MATVTISDTAISSSGALTASGALVVDNNYYSLVVVLNRLIEKLEQGRK